MSRKTKTALPPINTEAKGVGQKKPNGCLRNAGLAGTIFIILYLVGLSLPDTSPASPAVAENATEIQALAVATLDTATETPAPSMTLESTDDSGSITPALASNVLDNGDVVFEIDRIEARTWASDWTPLEGKIYLTVFGTITNPYQKTGRLAASQVRARVDGEDYRPFNNVMDQMRDDLNQMDYIGPESLNVLPGERLDVFVAFEVPADWQQIGLRLDEAFVWLAPEGAMTIAQVAPSPTLSPTTTLTPTITVTATITNTPVPTVMVQVVAATQTPAVIAESSEIAIQSISPRSYYAQSGGANIRTCPNTTCEAFHRLDSGQPFMTDATTRGQAVEGANDVWYRVEWRGQVGYVYSGVVGTQAPAAASSGSGGGPITLAPVPQSPAPQAGQTWDCSGDYYNCSSFNNRAEMDAYFAACPGDPSDLDGNDDGRYCEN